MISLLGDVVEILTNIPAYILYAIETAWNLLVSGLEGAWEAALAVLPGLPALGAPPYLDELNWFFPLGAVLAVAVPLLAAYVTFLGVRWIFGKFGEL